MRLAALLALGWLMPLQGWAEEDSTGGDRPEADPLHLDAGVAVIVPAESHGSVQSVQVGLGVELDEWKTLAIRVAVALSPVEAPSGPDADRAWAAIVEYRKQFGVGYQIDPFIAVAGGFVMGDRDEESVSNLVLPYGQLGMGLRLRLTDSRARNQFFVSPQIGLIPGALYDRGMLTVAAPYTGVDIGLLIP